MKSDNELFEDGMSRQQADALVEQWRGTPERVIYTPPLLLFAATPVNAPPPKASSPANTPQKRGREDFDNIATMASMDDIADSSMNLTSRATPQNKY